MNTALTRPSAAAGITRCSVVDDAASDMDPDIPTATAAGSAALSECE